MTSTTSQNPLGSAAPASDRRSERLSLFADRRSPRAFDETAELDDATLDSLLEAARWAPSAFNAQPWRFIVGRRGGEVFQRILPHLSESNQSWAHRA